MDYTDFKRKLSTTSSKCTGFQLFHYEHILKHNIDHDALIDVAEKIVDSWNHLSSEERNEYKTRE